MEQLLQQFASGLANGAIYACVALALVMIYVSTDHINFAQGEMAMFSTYISWQLMSWGMSFWVAFILTVMISFAMGVLIERLILRPLHNAPVLSIIVVFIGLLAIFNSMAGAFWSYLIKEFPSPFPKSDFGIAGAKDEGVVFAGGRALKKVPTERLVDELFEQIDLSLEKGSVVFDETESAEGEEWVRKIESENADDLTPEKIARMEREAAEKGESDRVLLDEEESPTSGRRFTRT